MRRNLRAFSSLFILALTTIEACSLDGPDIEDPVDTAVDAIHDTVIDPMTAEFVPGELLIQYEQGATEGQKMEVRARFGAVVAERIHTAAMRRSGTGTLERVSLPPTIDVVAAARALGRAPGVKFVEPNYIYRHAEISNDPLYTDGSLWGCYGDNSSPANAYGSQAAAAWATGATGSKGVVVGIIDTGVDFLHEDLANNIWTNLEERDGTTGVDDDENGFIDDIHGWDFFHGDNSIFDASDGDNHGTHVAGTIGAVGGNGKGVAGVNWEVQVVVAKFLGPNGGNTANAVKAIDYMIDFKKNRGLNLVALNNSWGGGGFSTSLRDAIQRANAEGILFVAAAGNNRWNNDWGIFAHYPSSYAVDNIIAVAAIDKNGKLASFSNYGRTTVDLGAPGVAIMSTIPSGYGLLSGTSMATPHVTGAIALFMATAPLDPPDHLAVKAALLASTIPTSALQNRCVTNGRLDISSFLSQNP